MATSDPPQSLRQRAASSGATFGPYAITALIASLPGLIAAFRTESDPQLKAKVDVLEADRIRRAVEAPGKEQEELAKIDARRVELDRLRSRIQLLEARCPPEKVDVSREPASR